MSVTDIILTVAGIYNVGMSLLMHTVNMRSAIVFKVIPFFVGLSCLYAAWILP